MAGELNRWFRRRERIAKQDRVKISRKSRARVGRPKLSCPDGFDDFGRAK